MNIALKGYCMQAKAAFAISIILSWMYVSTSVISSSICLQDQKNPGFAPSLISSEIFALKSGSFSSSIWFSPSSPHIPPPCIARSLKTSNPRTKWNLARGKWCFPTSPVFRTRSHHVSRHSIFYRKSSHQCDKAINHCHSGIISIWEMRLTSGRAIDEKAFEFMKWDVYFVCRLCELRAGENRGRDWIFSGGVFFGWKFLTKKKENLMRSQWISQDFIWITFIRYSNQESDQNLESDRQFYPPFSSIPATFAFLFFSFLKGFWRKSKFHFT